MVRGVVVLLCRIWDCGLGGRWLRRSAVPGTTRMPCGHDRLMAVVLSTSHLPCSLSFSFSGHWLRSSWSLRRVLTLTLTFCSPIPLRHATLPLHFSLRCWPFTSSPSLTSPDHPPGSLRHAPQKHLPRPPSRPPQDFPGGGARGVPEQHAEDMAGRVGGGGGAVGTGNGRRSGRADRRGEGVMRRAARCICI